MGRLVNKYPERPAERKSPSGRVQVSNGDCMTMNQISRHRSKERGFIALTYALVAFVLLGFAGLAVDVGYMQWNKRRAQAAADSAPMGALRQLQLGKDLSTRTTPGQNTTPLTPFPNT